MLSKELLEILCCPSEPAGKPCHGDLEERPDSLRCTKCGLVYPIEDGIPVMLVDSARQGE